MGMFANLITNEMRNKQLNIEAQQQVLSHPQNSVQEVAQKPQMQNLAQIDYTPVAKYAKQALSDIDAQERNKFVGEGLFRSDETKAKIKDETERKFYDFAVTKNGYFDDIVVRDDKYYGVKNGKEYDVTPNFLNSMASAPLETLGGTLGAIGGGAVGGLVGGAGAVPGAYVGGTTFAGLGGGIDNYIRAKLTNQDFNFNDAVDSAKAAATEDAVLSGLGDLAVRIGAKALQKTPNVKEAISKTAEVGGSLINKVPLTRFSKQTLFGVPNANLKGAENVADAISNLDKEQILQNAKNFKNFSVDSGNSTDLNIINKPLQYINEKAKNLSQKLHFDSVAEFLAKNGDIDGKRADFLTLGLSDPKMLNRTIEAVQSDTSGEAGKNLAKLADIDTKTIKEALGEADMADLGKNIGAYFQKSGENYSQMVSKISNFAKGRSVNLNDDAIEAMKNEVLNQTSFLGQINPKSQAIIKALENLKGQSLDFDTLIKLRQSYNKELNSMLNDGTSYASKIDFKQGKEILDDAILRVIDNEQVAKYFKKNVADYKDFKNLQSNDFIKKIFDENADDEAVINAFYKLNKAQGGAYESLAKKLTPKQLEQMEKAVIKKEFEANIGKSGLFNVSETTNLRGFADRLNELNFKSPNMNAFKEHINQMANARGNLSEILSSIDGNFIKPRRVARGIATTPKGAIKTGYINALREVAFKYVPLIGNDEALKYHLKIAAKNMKFNGNDFKTNFINSLRAKADELSPKEAENLSKFADEIDKIFKSRDRQNTFKAVFGETENFNKSVNLADSEAENFDILQIARDKNSVKGENFTINGEKIGKLAIEKSTGEVKHATKTKEKELKRLEKVSKENSQSGGIIQTFIHPGSELKKGLGYQDKIIPQKTEISKVENLTLKKVREARARTAWMKAFNLKSVDDEFVPNLEPKIKEIIGDDLHLTKGSFEKLLSRGRLELLPHIRENLEHPHLVIEHENAFLFVRDIGKESFLTSVSKNSDGKWVVSSNSYKTLNNLKNKIGENGEVKYISEKAPNILAETFKVKAFSNQLNNEIIPQKTEISKVENLTKTQTDENAQKQHWGKSPIIKRWFDKNGKIIPPEKQVNTEQVAKTETKTAENLDKISQTETKPAEFGNLLLDNSLAKIREARAKMQNNFKAKNLTPQEIKDSISKWKFQPNKQEKLTLSQIGEAEAEQLKKEFNFKGEKPLVREIDSDQIKHTLKQHGNAEIEAQRGQIAVTLDDIADYENIVKTADKRATQENGKILYAKQINGHYVVIEEALTGKDKLRFFDMWKVKGNLNNEVLFKPKTNAQTRAINLNDSVNMPNSTNRIIPQKTEISKVENLDKISQSEVKPAEFGNLLLDNSLAKIRELKNYSKAEQETIAKIEQSTAKGRDMEIIGKENLTANVVKYISKYNKSVAVDKLDPKIAKKLGYKYPNDVRRTIKADDIEHTLQRHGENSQLVKQSGQKPVTYDDIANYQNLADSADKVVESVDKSGNKVLVSDKQINGYYVVVEQIRKKNNELSFKTMYFENGKLKNNKSFAPKTAEAANAQMGYEPKAKLDFDNAKPSEIIPQNVKILEKEAQWEKEAKENLEYIKSHYVGKDGEKLTDVDVAKSNAGELYHTISKKDKDGASLISTEKESMKYLLKKYPNSSEAQLKYTLDRLRKSIEIQANISPIKEFGTNYAEFYHDSVNAVKKLLVEKQGQVSGAFYRKDLGDIDLVWGEVSKKANGEIDGYGLSKILQKHSKDFEPFGGIENAISEIIEKGTLKVDKNGRATIIYKAKDDKIYNLGLKQNWMGEKTKNKWIITAYNDTKAEVREAGNIINSNSFTKGKATPLNSNSEIIPQNVKNLSKEADELAENFSLSSDDFYKFLKKQYDLGDIGIIKRYAFDDNSQEAIDKIIKTYNTATEKDLENKFVRLAFQDKTYEFKYAKQINEQIIELLEHNDPRVKAFLTQKGKDLNINTYKEAVKRLEKAEIETERFRKMAVDYEISLPKAQNEKPQILTKEQIAEKQAEISKLEKEKSKNLTAIEKLKKEVENLRDYRGFNEILNRHRRGENVSNTYERKLQELAEHRAEIRALNMALNENMATPKKYKYKNSYFLEQEKKQYLGLVKDLQDELKEAEPLTKRLQKIAELENKNLNIAFKKSDLQSEINKSGGGMKGGFTTPIIPQLITHSGVGTISGVANAKDENGEFDLGRFGAGFLAGLGGSIAVNKTLKSALNTYAKNKAKIYPNMAKNNPDEFTKFLNNKLKNDKISKFELGVKELEKLDNAKLTPKQQEIVEVFKGERTATELRLNDLGEVASLEQGSRHAGARKIMINHAGIDKTGGLNGKELAEIENILTNGKIRENSFKVFSDKLRYAYEMEQNGVKYNVVVDEFSDNKKVFYYYSDRNFIDYKAVNSKQQPTPNTADNEIISKENKGNIKDWRTSPITKKWFDEQGRLRKSE